VTVSNGEVRLSWEECFEALVVGVRRFCNARQDERRQLYRPVWKHGYLPDLEGACAEKAFAKLSGLYWPATVQPDSREGDVSGWHIRSTTHEDGALILHERDADDARFALMTGFAPGFILRGGIDGATGKRLGKFQQRGDGAPAYYVDQHLLRTITKG